MGQWFLYIWAMSLTLIAAVYNAPIEWLGIKSVHSDWYSGWSFITAIVLASLGVIAGQLENEHREKKEKNDSKIVKNGRNKD